VGLYKQATKERNQDKMKTNPNESILNVPLDDDTKRRLADTARENGRATCREAAAIIKRGLLLPAPKKGTKA
jgi:hypothetical protein